MDAQVCLGNVSWERGSVAGSPESFHKVFSKQAASFLLQSLLPTWLF